MIEKYSGDICYIADVHYKICFFLLSEIRLRLLQLLNSLDHRNPNLRLLDEPVVVEWEELWVELQVGVEGEGLRVRPEKYQSGSKWVSC